MLKSNDEYKNVILKNIDIANKNSPNRPVKINGKGYCEVPEGVTKIDNGCFYNRIKLKKIELPETLKEIGDYAFKFSEIPEIQIPEGVFRIGTGCFQNSSILKEIKLPSNLREIGDYAFKLSDIPKIYIPEGVIKIGTGCFCQCYRLTSVSLPGTLKEISNDAFEYCFNLKTIIAPTNVINLLKSSKVMLPRNIKINERK